MRLLDLNSINSEGDLDLGLKYQLSLISFQFILP